jgi:hypothetical protein
VISILRTLDAGPNVPISFRGPRIPRFLPFAFWPDFVNAIVSNAVPRSARAHFFPLFFILFSSFLKGHSKGSRAFVPRPDTGEGLNIPMGHSERN